MIHCPQNSPVPAVVVNANNIAALLPIRALGRKGIPVTCVFGRGNLDQYAPVVRSSRFISKTQMFDESDYEQNVIECLLKIGRTCREKVVLFPASDLDMIIISANRHVLEPYYHLLMPSHVLLSNLLNKDWFYPFAEATGIPVPRTFHIHREGDIDTVARKLAYPCIVKPAWRDEAWQTQYGNQKVLIANSANELRLTFRGLYDRFEELAVQEIIQGGECNIICSFTYLNENSEPLGIFTSAKIRQFPPHFGNSSLVQQVKEPKVVQMTIQICKQLGLVGYVSIEFKKDDRDGAFKVIEITPCRFNRQAGLSDVTGLCLPYVWYCHLLKRPIQHVIKNSDCAWVSEVNEVRAFWEYWRSGEYTIAEWVRSYKHVALFEVFAKDDPLPFMMLLPSALSHWVRRRIVRRSSSPKISMISVYRRMADRKKAS